jgi:hypothetical protein
MSVASHSLIRRFLKAVMDDDFAGPHIGRQCVIDFLVKVSTELYTPGTASFRDLSLIIDGDLAAARFKIAGRLVNAAKYINDYVYWIRLSGDRIAEVWEFVDTSQFNNILSGETVIE